MRTARGGTGIESILFFLVLVGKAFSVQNSYAIYSFEPSIPNSFAETLICLASSSQLKNAITLYFPIYLFDTFKFHIGSIEKCGYKLLGLDSTTGSVC